MLHCCWLHMAPILRNCLENSYQSTAPVDLNSRELRMLRIKPSNVPAHLKISAFFENLGDDDQEVAVPKNCCKLDTSVENPADLGELLQTLRFWGVDRIPISVVRFIISNDRSVWDPVTVSYVTDLPSVAQLVQVVECDRDKQVCKAAVLRNVDIVTCLVEHGYPAEHGPITISYRAAVTRAVDIAARNGDLHILEILALHNCPFHEDTGRAAALGGHYECLEYLVRNGCPVADDLVNCAFVGGSIECLRYVHESLGCSWDEKLFWNLSQFVCQAQANAKDIADEHLLLQCLEYAQDHDCPRDPEACCTCGQYGLLQMLQRLHEYGWPWDEQVSAAAARYGHLACLKYASEHGCPLSDDFLMWEAMLSGKVGSIQYLHDRGLPWPAEYTLELLEAHIDGDGKEVIENVRVCLAYAYKLGCPRDPEACYFASIYGWYDILVDAHQHGGELHSHCTWRAAANGHLDCLVYLHEQGCPWQEASTTIDAVANKHFDCFTYAAEHGCPVPPHTFSSAIFSGSMEMIQNLHDRGVAWPDDILSGIEPRVFPSKDQARQAEDCLQFAYQLGCPRDPQTCFYASGYGWYDVLVDAHRPGMSLSTSCAQQAAANGHLRCLAYLHEHGCPWDKGTTLGALRSLSYTYNDAWGVDNYTEHGLLTRAAQRNQCKECLIYALEHGCPLPAKEDKHWWPSEDVELQQYLLDKGGVRP